MRETVRVARAYNDHSACYESAPDISAALIAVATYRQAPRVFVNEELVLTPRQLAAGS